MEETTPYAGSTDGFRVTLPRSGDAPLQFDGVEIASIEGRDVKRARDGTSRHSLRAWKAADGRFVAAIDYRTTMRSEPAWHGAVVAASVRDLRMRLLAYDAADRLRLPVIDPEAHGATTKQARDDETRRDVREQWAEVIEQTLEALEFVDKADEPPQYLSLRAVAALKGCSASTVRSAANAGVLHPAVEIVDEAGKVSAVGFVREEAESWTPAGPGWKKGRSRNDDAKTEKTMHAYKCPECHKETLSVRAPDRDSKTAPMTPGGNGAIGAIPVDKCQNCGENYATIVENHVEERRES